LISDGVPYFRDALLTYYPILVYLRERLRRGELPQWYPYEALGSPFIGQVVTQTFHPVTWLLIPFTAATALKVVVLGSYLAALFGAYRWVRCFSASRVAAVGGAFAYAFGGYALSMSNNPNYLMGVATLPWVAESAWRLIEVPSARRCARLAAMWSLLFLSGDVQTFLVAAAVPLGALALRGSGRRRPLGVLALAVALVSATIAVELIPALILDRTSLRTIGKPLASSGFLWALHPLRVPEFLIGGLVPDEVRAPLARTLLGGRTSFWTMNVFAGASVLALALAGAMAGGRKRWLASIVAFLGLWMALGAHAGLLPVVSHLIPPLAHFRFPEKYLVFFWLGLGPLVALGVDSLAHRIRPVLATAATLGLVLALFALATRFLDPLGSLWARSGGLPTELPSLRTAVQGVWLRDCCVGIAVLVAVAALSAGMRSGLRLSWMFPVVILLELLRVNGALLPLADREFVETPLPFLRATGRPLEAGGPPSRVIRTSKRPLPAWVTGNGADWVVRTRASLLPDAGAVDGAHVFGFELPAESARYALVFGPGGQRQSEFGPSFGGCLVLSDDDQAPPAGGKLVAVERRLGYALWRRPCLLPARLAGAVPAPNLFAAAAQLPRLALDREAVWEGGPTLPDASGSVRWLRASPEALVLDATSQATAALVVDGLFSPGWMAQVDGRASPIYPANVVSRGVLIPPGHHRVELSYRTPGLVTGALLSMLGLLGLIACLLVGQLRQRRVREAG
jgi:hypothetical protein